MKKEIFPRSVVCDKNVTDVNQNSKYIVRESIDFGCKVYKVVNTKSCNRVNYFADYESAIVLVVILWNISPALVITSALIGIAMAIGKTKGNKSGE